MSKRKPWRKFYPTDYLGDPALSQCSFGAQGLWARLMCHAWLSAREGFVVKPDGSAITPDDISAGYLVSRDNPGQVRRYMQELLDHQVCSIDEETGAIISRRIVRDSAAAVIARQNGRLGGNPALLRLDNQGDNQQVNSGGYARSASASASASASDSGSGLEGESEGKPTPSVLAFWHAYPASKRTQQGKVIEQWNECLAEGADPDAIIAAAKRFAESPLGRSRFAVTAPRFLGDRMYLDPPEAWENASEATQTPRRDYKAMFAEDER